ncbi:acyltransferase [Bizionia sp.]|uniref:acyltransferase n=1 Tax=Bizionia sp. TaxID=1954480 RepID=UPI003A9000B4
MKKLLTLLFGLIPINIIKIFLLRTLGHAISYNSYIGFGILATKNIELKKHSKIKHFNFIKVESLILEESGFIGSFNILNGPLTIFLEKHAGISKQNKIRRSKAPISYGKAELHLGENAIIVSNHFLDLTKSVSLGNNSILAGIGSQLWTHGYYHADFGKERIRIDGEIHIGNNVYIGSGCIFNPGVNVANAIHIGAGSVISKNLELSGMYVGQGLRYIENDLGIIQSKLKKVEGFNLVEQVYTK